SGKWARRRMIWANNLANAMFLDDKRHTCDHLVEASTRTIKYRNVPHGGCIGPQMSPCIRSRKFIVSLVTFTSEGLIMSFPCVHATHVRFFGITLLSFRSCPLELRINLRIMF